MKDKITIKEIKEKIREIENIEEQFNNEESINAIEFSKYDDLLKVFTTLDNSVKLTKLCLPSLEIEDFGIKVWKEIYKIKRIKKNNDTNLVNKLIQELINKINNVKISNEEDKIKQQNIIELIKEELQ